LEPSQRARGFVSHWHTGVWPAGQPIDTLPSSHCALQLAAGFARAPWRAAVLTSTAAAPAAAASRDGIGGRASAHCEYPGPDWQA
jgi:hypothetical protein